MNTYLWDFGDGHTSTEENPVHVYETEGTYTVSLTVDNGYSSATTTKEAYVVVDQGVNPTVRLQLANAVQYLAEYQYYSPGCVALSETGWDEVNVDPDAGPIFNGDLLDWTYYEETNAVKVTSQMYPSVPTCVEFVVNVLPPSNYLAIGTWEDGFGPYWNPYSGEPAVPCLWVSDGRTITYGGTNSGGPTFTDGDVIGVVWNGAYAGTLYFFKNGEYVQTLNTNASSQWAMVSLVSDPS